MAQSGTKTVAKTTVFGDLRVVFGTYANAGGSTGGDIVTGLAQVLYFDSNYMTTQATTVNLISISGGTVSMTCVDGEDGQWMAIGV